MSSFRTLSLAVAIAAAVGTTSPAGAHGFSPFGHTQPQFERIASFPVYLNTDAGNETVAEIIDATRDGRTLVYTDAETENLGFIDISNPYNPKPAGVVAMGGEPTSVAVRGRYALVAVNTSDGYVNTSGHLSIVDIASRTVVAQIDLGGQPDSVAVSPNGRYAAVAIENERDEDLGDGGLPQAPGGFLVIVDLRGNPSMWTTRTVNLSDGSLSTIFPYDSEPEFVDINKHNIAAVTLQENNGMVYVDLRSGAVVNDYDLGTVDLTDIDTVEDDVIRLNGSLNDVPREPDAVKWIDERYVATANEGDWHGGSRGISIFSMDSATPVYDSGNTLEHIAVRHGHYPESRSENKGAEIEGLAHARFGANDFLFAGSERGNFVAVYQLRKRAEPEFVQLLPTMNGPEGLLAIPNRGLFVATSEVDDADNGLRASVSIFKLRKKAASYPTIVSNDDANGNPIPWGALSALVGDANDADKLYSVHDSYYKEPEIYTIDVSEMPAHITSAIPLSNCGDCDYDLEGITQDADGTFWLASEGKVGGRGNLLIHAAPNGEVLEEVALPASVQVKKEKHGFEGVAVDGDYLYVAFQRSWGRSNPAVDADEHPRIGRYDLTNKTWAFYSYPLDAAPAIEKAWVGLSELTYLGNDTFAVIERDNQRGVDATVKRLYTFSVAGQTPVAEGAGSFPVLTKTFAYDLLPGLQAPHGWVQDKAEGLGVTADGEVYMVTDNDGVDDSTGETQFQHLGNLNSVFGL